MTTPPGSTPLGKGDASSSRTVKITTAMRADERSGKERTVDGKTVSRARPPWLTGVDFGEWILPRLESLAAESDQ